MIGLVIVTHGRIAQELLATAQSILGPSKQVYAVGIERSQGPDDIRLQIAEAISAARGDGGCLVLTDLFGGTPTNLCSSFICSGKVEIVSGVNLPMVIKCLGLRASAELLPLAKALKEYGQNNIHIVSEILKPST